MFIALCILIIAIFACVVCPNSEEASQLYYDVDIDESVNEEEEEADDFSEEDSEDLADDDEAAVEEPDVKAKPKKAETLDDLKKTAKKHDPVTKSAPTAKSILDDLDL